jgi:hypothetical protein
MVTVYYRGMTQTPTRGATFQWRGQDWTVTSVRKLPYDESGEKLVAARNQHGDMIRFGTVEEWRATVGA